MLVNLEIRPISYMIILITVILFDSTFLTHCPVFTSISIVFLLCSHYDFLGNEANSNNSTTTTIDVSIINSDGSTSDKATAVGGTTTTIDVLTNSHNSTSNKATAVEGAVGGTIVGMLLLVALVIFVTCIVKLKRSRKGNTSTEEYSMLKLESCVISLHLLCKHKLILCLTPFQLIWPTSMSTLSLMSPK